VDQEQLLLQEVSEELQRYSSLQPIDYGTTEDKHGIRHNLIGHKTKTDVPSPHWTFHSMLVSQLAQDNIVCHYINTLEE